MLLELRSFTATAVTGPGRLLASPTAVHVEFEMKYFATFATVLSASAMEPAAMITSSLLYTRKRMSIVFRMYAF